MDSKKYNEQRYNRKKQKYRFLLGVQQLSNYPILNLIWVIFAIGIIFCAEVEKKYVQNIEVYPMFTTIFSACMTIILIAFPIICAIGFIQMIGFCFAIKDESDLELVFAGGKNIKDQPPLLVRKKKDRKSGVIRREFYTSIPMEEWQKKREAICDRMDIYLIGDITYGGNKKNKGNHIYFEAINGRKPKERGVLYDEIF